MIAKSLVLLFLAFVVVLAKPQEKYTTKYDNIDIDRIIKNDRLLQNYVKCLLDKGKCSQDGMELKRILPDALETGCIKCSETQERNTRKIVDHLIKNKRSMWNELEAKYDKNGSYRKRYEARLMHEGIKV